jgi:putative ABC transport system ATP-binding protein
MIRTRSLTVTFNAGTPLETRAMRGVDLDIPQGEFVAVIGSNGAGKSTLLNAVSGEVAITAGSVVIDEADVTAWSAPRRAGLIARVFQDPMAGTCADLTVEENLALAHGRGRRGTLRAALARERRDEFRDLLATLGLGLETRLGDSMGRLSGGQRQSVSLLMATLRPSSILLLDEHTAALDPKTGAAVLALTDRIVTEKKLTTLMVTHSMRHALDHGSRVVMMHEGRIAFDVKGEERAGLDVPDLLALFSRVRGEELDDDKLLLG